MITVPRVALMIFSMRWAARSTSGSQSDQAVIDLVAHCSANSARSSLARPGTQPRECEMRWTHCSRAGNCARYSSRLSATGSAMVARILSGRLGRAGPVGEDLVADVPQPREEALLHAVGEEVGVLALERRRAGADDPVDQHQVAVAPGLQQLVVVDQPLAHLVDDVQLVRLVVDLAQGQALRFQVADEGRPHDLAGQAQHGAEAGRLLPR